MISVDDWTGERNTYPSISSLINIISFYYIILVQVYEYIWEVFSGEVILSNGMCSWLTIADIDSRAIKY
jgi:hypothetical protein